MIRGCLRQRAQEESAAVVIMQQRCDRLLLCLRHAVLQKPPACGPHACQPLSQLAFMRLHQCLTAAGYSLHPPRCCPHLLITCPSPAPAGWRYDGTLCTGHGDTGLVWECPLLIRLNSYQPAPASLPVHTLGLDRGTGPLSPSVSLRAMTLLDAVSSLPDGAQSSSESAEADER